jgi:hypothetical protein
MHWGKSEFFSVGYFMAFSVLIDRMTDECQFGRSHHSLSEVQYWNFLGESKQKQTLSVRLASIPAEI